MKHNARGALVSAVHGVAWALLDYLAPRSCALCGGACPGGMPGLCARCRAGLEPPVPGCKRCSGLLENGVCTLCADRNFYPVRNITLGEYRGSMKTLLKAYKFGGRRDLSSVFAGLALPALALVGPLDLVTAVPMNRAKERRRGYNQSYLIARSLARQAGLPCRPVLAETSAAGVQRELGLRRRFINVLGRYTLSHREAVAGRRILLVDDVFTTGATVNECARILRQGGASEVFSLTMARSPIKKLEMD